MSEPIHIISLGAGVQSSTMALMAAHGEITPMPNAAVFADTGDEPSEVYRYLEYLIPRLPFPVFIAKNSLTLSEGLISGGFSQIPAFMKGQGIGKRQCTRHWKIDPIKREIRRQFPKAKRAVLWQGISTDEAHRAKDSRVKWLTHTFPLLDKRMSREGCKRWIEEMGFMMPPKSACVFCPFRSRSQWLESRRRGGEEWSKIVMVSRLLEQRGEFLTPACLPIDQTPLTDNDIGQSDLFGNECEGMCGV